MSAINQPLRNKFKTTGKFYFLFLVGTLALAGTSLSACGNDDEARNYRVVDLADQNADQVGQKADNSEPTRNPPADAQQNQQQDIKPTAQADPDDSAAPKPALQALENFKLSPPVIVSIKGKGKLSKKSIQRSLNKKFHSLSRCSQGQHGQNKVTLKINKRGKIDYVKAREKMDRKILLCLSKTIKTWRFAKPRGGAVYLTVKISY